MRIRIPKKYQARLSKVYLDWAEMLPRFGGGPINALQLHREHQRKDAEDTYQRTRLPEGIEVEYLFFRLFELFQIEDFERLQKLLEIFPQRDTDSENDNLSRQLREQARHISGGAWWNIGTLTKDGRWFGIRQATLKPNLPEEVDRIDVEAFQLMPSIFIVSFDACLNEKATTKLVRLHDRRYLPEIRFADLIPSEFTSHSEGTADAVMSEEIFHWLEELRGKVENCLRPYANGYFTQHSPATIARLPAFEVFVVKGVGEMANGLSNWLGESHMWLRSFGFSPGFVTYANEEVVLLPSEDSLWWNKSAKSPQRLLILWEPYAKAKGKEGNNLTNGSVIHQMQFLLSDILPSFAVLEFLGFVQRRIEDLRQKVFRQVNSGWFKRITHGPQTGLNDRILQESFLLDRLITEFKQHESSISTMQRFSRDAAKLKSLQVSTEDVQRLLKDDLHESIKHRMQILRENATLIKDWFSQYSTIRTTEATGCMNSILVLFTSILVILTIVLVWLTYVLAQKH